MEVSSGLAAWLAQVGCSLAVSTYDAGKLILLGNNGLGGCSLFERTIEGCMGLHSDGDLLHLAARSQVLRFRDAGAAGGWDRRYLPRMAWYTGDVDAHDLGVDAAGRPLVVATAFNAVVRVSEDTSFEPVWWPRFLPGPVQGDRCHLNGFATEGGEVAVVTLAGPSDRVDGWRDHRDAGGQVLDARTHEVLADGLCLPHSPRLHDGRVWFLEAGHGRLCVIDGGKTEVVAELPGFTRGLSFIGGYAVVGLSAPRNGELFDSLPLGRVAAERGQSPMCGVVIVDLATGRVDHFLAVHGNVIREIYDVAVLKGAARPMAVGFRGGELNETFDLRQVAACA
jgi:uncharacterized protein (TIGR03032 family)